MAVQASGTEAEWTGKKLASLLVVVEVPMAGASPPLLRTPQATMVRSGMVPGTARSRFCTTRDPVLPAFSVGRGIWFCLFCLRMTQTPGQMRKPPAPRARGLSSGPAASGFLSVQGGEEMRFPPSASLASQQPRPGWQRPPVPLRDTRAERPAGPCCRPGGGARGPPGGCGGTRDRGGLCDGQR